MLILLKQINLQLSYPYMKVVNSCFQQIHPFYNETNSSRQNIYKTRVRDTGMGQLSRNKSSPKNHQVIIRLI